MAYRTKMCEEGGMYNASRPIAYSAETRAFLNGMKLYIIIIILPKNTIQML